MLDGLVFVGAIAVGLALVRLTGGSVSPSFATRPIELRQIQLRNIIRMLITPILVCLTIATLACGMVPPGSPRRWRIRSPGMIACLSVAIAVLTQSAWHLGHIAIGLSTDVMLHSVIFPWQAQASYAVIISWISLWLVGRWRPGPPWPDRLGRIIGWLWVSLELVARTCETLIYAMR